MSLRNYVIALTLLASATVPTLKAFAQDSAVDPEKVKVAAEEFDAGRRAFKQKEFARAAAHFENAFRDAPSAQAMRMAIRARQEAGELARAATLCVRAQALYPEDRETVTLAQKVLQDNTPKLQKVTVQCDPACALTLDGKLVRDDAATSQVIFVDPGDRVLVAGWSKNRSVSRTVTAKPGGSSILDLTAPPEPPPEPSASATSPAASAASSAPAPPADTTRVDVDTRQGAPPTLFWLAVGATTVTAAVTVWSGLDTRANPGPDTVRQKCVGLGTTCPEYQQGLSNERRTNLLLAGTAVGVVSTAVIGVFFTDWSGGSEPKERSARLVPSVDATGAVGLSAAGRF